MRSPNFRIRYPVEFAFACNCKVGRLPVPIHGSVDERSCCIYVAFRIRLHSLRQAQVWVVAFARLRPLSTCLVEIPHLNCLFIFARETGPVLLAQLWQSKYLRLSLNFFRPIQVGRLLLRREKGDILQHLYHPHYTHTTLFLLLMKYNRLQLRLSLQVAYKLLGRI